jgi:crotonobetaine/carnitine-CoA ligase
MFPPDPTSKKGFFDESVYIEALKRYKSIPELIRKKAEENGDNPCLIFQDGRKYTYKHVNLLSDNIAINLLSRGFKSGDKIAIFALNSPEWVLAYFGILKAGCIPVTVNTSFVKDPLIYNFQMADAISVILDSRLASNFVNVQSALSEIKSVFVIGDTNEDTNKVKGNVENFSNLLNNISKNGEFKLPELAGKDPSAMILTSGTTGRSKVVVESNAQFIATALDMIDAGGVASGSRIYVYLPLFHIMALDLAVISSILSNSTVYLVEKFNPSTFWKDIAKYHITHFHAVGPIFEVLIKQEPSIEEKQHETIIAIAYSSKEIWTAAEDRFGIKITGGYGGTEAGIPVTSPYSEVINGINPPGSCGKATPPYEVAIIDESGFPVINGATGEIVIRPKLPWVTFLEYYKMQKESLQAFTGLWFHTGDLGKYDDNGYIYFVDRSKDSIRRRGENISSFEVEQSILKMDGVLEVAVYPVPSSLGEDEVMLSISRKNIELKPENIIDYCLDNMPAYWLPNYIRFLDSLPKTPTGRIEKYKLKNEGITKETYHMSKYIKDRLKNKP